MSIFKTSNKSKNDLLKTLKKNEKLDSRKKKLLKYILNLHYEFIPYSFSEYKDDIFGDWDLLYVTGKSDLVNALLMTEKHWNIAGFCGTGMDENIFSVIIHFNKAQLIENFVYSKYMNDSRERFVLLEIYFSEFDQFIAYKVGLIKNMF